MTPSRLERLFSRVFGDPDPKTVGSGWMSGTASVFLGVLAVFGVLSFAYPDLFTTAEFVALYPVAALRVLIEIVIGLSFLLGAASLMLRRRKVLGLTGLALSFAALLAGGGSIEARVDGGRTFTIGLDWFALNLLLLAVVFVPIERAFPKRPEQTTFRHGWTTDGVHFLVSHLAVQALTFLTLLPATSVAALWQPGWLHEWIRAQPLWVQALEIVLVADLAQYWIHRAFTSCRPSGACTRCITRARRSTGWPARGCTWSTSS